MYIFFVSPFDRLENISRPSLDKDISSKIAQRVTLAVGSWKRAFFLVFDLSFSLLHDFPPWLVHATLFILRIVVRDDSRPGTRVD